MTGVGWPNVQTERNRPSAARSGASSLEEDAVAPAAASIAPDPFLDPDAAEADALVEGQARLVLDEDPSLQRPVTDLLGGGDEGLEQCPTDAAGRATRPPRTRSPRRRRHRLAATRRATTLPSRRPSRSLDLGRRSGISAGAIGPSATNPGPRSRRSRRPSRSLRRRSGAHRASPLRPSARSGRALPRFTRSDPARRPAIAPCAHPVRPR